MGNFRVRFPATMLGPRVRWQMLLGFVLLLGQPVFGDSDATEELPLAESEELVPIPEEPEEPVPELQEPEEPVPVSEEPEDPMPKLEDLGLPVTEEPKKELTSDEKLEMSESQEREWLKEDLSRSWNYELIDIQRTALDHHHKHSEEYYRTFEKANLKTQKAIGTMIYLSMNVVKTNCTNDRQPKEEESDHSYYYRLYHADRYPRNCESLSDEKQKCMFVFFEDPRNPGEPIVINQDCINHEMFDRDLDFLRERLMENK